jgi:dipeptidyl-peptidase-4
VVPVVGGPTVWIQWDNESHPYLTTVRWDNHGPLTIAVQSRNQGELVLLEADHTTGVTRELLEEQDGTWVNVRQDVPRWLAADRGFLWASESHGAWQLEWRGPRGALENIIVPAQYGFTKLLGCNTVTGEILFAGRPDATQQRLYRTTLQGGTIVELTPRTGWHTAVANDDLSFHVQTATTLETMPRTTVHRNDGTRLGELPSLAEEPPFIPRVELVHLGEAPGFHAALVRPRNFDFAARYPVIVHVYGGPLPHDRSGVVTTSMGSWLLRQWIADQGFVVVCADGRGTPGRGRDWERAIFKRLGTIPLTDLVTALRLLVSRFPELDPERVGVFGWSFGGYLSALAVLKEPDLFKTAVAGAPVTDWADYDTHYTERYLGMPETDAEAYREASLLTWAPGLHRPLLLMHGTDDDNVYFRHTLKLADALFRAGRHFELLPLSGFTHMVPDPHVNEQLYARIMRHFKSALGEPTLAPMNPDRPNE